MKRNISIIGLLFMSMSAIIGSGWLFAASYADTLAGSASLVSWVVGGILVIIIAFVFAEVCTIVPVIGSSSRIPHFTHGTLTSYAFAWITWLSYLIYAPTEVQATIQYLSVKYPSLTVSGAGALSTQGYLLAAAILLLFSIINVYSIRWLVRANSILTVIKVIIPVFVSIVILCYFFTSFGQIMHPAGAPFSTHGLHGILTAISVVGIIFAFNGFKLAAEMAGDCKNPKVALPIAIIGSVVICLFIYLLLQTAFLSATGPGSNLANSHLGPFASLAKDHNLKMLVPFIYAGAIIAPIAAGLMYFSSASKSLYGMSKNGYLPGIFGKINAHDNPVYSIFITFIVGLLIFLFFKGWDTMASIITVLFALTYVVGTISMSTLRVKLPKIRRPFRLVFGHLWSIVAFFACTLMFYWCGWDIVYKADIIIAIGMVCLFLYKFYKRKTVHIELNFKQSIWLWIYLVGASVISYLSTFGGINVLSNALGSILLFILCVITLLLAMFVTRKPEEIQESIAEAMRENR
ncbi:MAG TPA: APC family permease [Victivallales bacterium]|nr:APC family permease [Victivallales bacterium]